MVTDMRYIAASRYKAEAAGFRMLGRVILKPGRVILNEKEVITRPGLTGTLEERVAALGGQIYSHNDISNLIRSDKK